MQDKSMSGLNREHSSMDEHDNDGDNARSTKRSRRNWTRGQAACTRFVMLDILIATELSG